MSRLDRLIAIAAFVVVFTIVLMIPTIFDVAVGAVELLVLLVFALALTVVLLRAVRSRTGRVR